MTNQAIRTWTPVIDTHAHVFLRELPLIDGAKLSFKSSHTSDDYLATLDNERIPYGVIAAVSVLGSYNDYTLQALRQTHRLRGTVNLDPNTDPYTMRAMADEGIVGVRYSLRRDRSALPDFTSAEHRRFLRRVIDLDWYVHVMAESEKLAVLVPQLASTGLKLVIDHFGVPDASQGENAPGFRAVLWAIDNGRTWIKLAAPYRNSWPDMKQLAARYLDVAGPSRVLWGSDWPFISHEGKFDYGDTVKWFEEWVPDAAVREEIGRTGLHLNKFV